jgi:poly[(R)-3-hydroxyalkanoate] polymerase subunit PhaC
MKEDSLTTKRITPDDLLNSMGVTPADNYPGIHTALPWKSKIVGQQIRSLIHYRHFLEDISTNPLFYGPFSAIAAMQGAAMDMFITGPVKAQARIAARSGINPDIFGEMNGWIYQSYARLLYNLCGHFMVAGKFNRKKALKVTSTPEGKAFLKEYMEGFAELEKNYNSMGMTRLASMKTLLKSILVTITEKALEGEPLPFMTKNPDGTDAYSISKYLEENRRRLENLYRENAFDIKGYSERATQNRIGYLPYEVIEGSKMHSVTLRRYLPTEGIKPNGKVLYMATPLINKPELFDLAKGKSVVEGMLNEGFHVYMVDHGDAGPEETDLGLDFFGKTIPDYYFEIIKKRHPREDIYVMGYCMGGTIMLPYLARRAEELQASGKSMDIKKIALMASPVKFDDDTNGHGHMRDVIRHNYDALVMKELFGDVNIPPQVIEAGMNEIQPGVQYTVSLGFYARAHDPHAVQDSAPFLYWLTHGTRFPARAHRDWIEKIFMDNQIYEGKYCLPSANPDFDGKPVNMGILKDAGVRIFCYSGTRDPIAPVGSCVASELWGQTGDGNIGISRGGLNRTIEKNIGHIFVVSKQLLAEYLQIVSEFFRS